MVITPQNSLRRSIEALLEQGGYTVCPGVDNLKGFQHALNASETIPNVIMVDFWLSRSITIDFLNSLKRQGFAIILMGTTFLGADIADSVKVGFIEKPFTSDTIMESLAHLIKMRDTHYQMEMHE